MKRTNRRERRNRGPAMNGGGLFWWHLYGALVQPDGAEGEAIGAAICYGPTTIKPGDRLPNGELVSEIKPRSPEGVQGSYVTSFDHSPTAEEEETALQAWKTTTDAIAQSMNAALLAALQQTDPLS